MPCSDYSGVRPGKSVPPKKSHSWRSLNITSPEDQSLSLTLENKDSPTKSDLPLNMGSSIQSDPQNDNHQRFENIPAAAGPSEDLPLDFSFKAKSKSSLSENTPKSSDERHSPVITNGHPVGYPSVPTEQIFFRGRDFNPLTSIEADHQQTNRSSLNFYERMQPTVSSQADQSSCSLDMVKSEVSNDQDLESSRGREQNLSPSPHRHSADSSSPILAGMLARNSPDMLPALSREAMNSRLATFGLQNGYPSSHNAMYLQSCISSCMMPSPGIFPPGGIVAPPAVAFMPTPLNVLGHIPQVSPPSKVENKVPRKVKKERPFKNYDVSLQDNLRWSVPFTKTSPSREDPHLVPTNVPHQNGTNNMNGNSSSSSDSDPHETSEIDNVPHSSVPTSSAPEEYILNGRGRKRKPVADSEKDDSYWERRKKNNQAAKRSRENRRIKEDTVAQQALYFRGETSRLSQLLIHMNARVHDMSMKCASLEQDKLTLTAENAMFKQLVNQKRCGQCGNHLSDKML